MVFVKCLLTISWKEENMNKKIICLVLIVLFVISSFNQNVQAQTTIEWITLGAFDRNKNGKTDIRFGGDDIGEFREVSFDN